MFKKSVIRKNLILTLLFGISMGIIFPVFASFFVIYNNEKAKLIFTVLSVFAGIFVGVTAFVITKITIIKIIKLLGKEMSLITSGKVDSVQGLSIQSEDSLGLLVNEFNKFIVSANNMSKILNDVIENDLNISNSLDVSYKKTIDNSEVIQKSINETLNNIDENTTSIENSSKLTQLITTDTDKLFNLIKNQKSNLEITTKSIYSILDSINKTEMINQNQLKEIDEIYRALKTSSKTIDIIDSRINTIETDSSKISDITKKIHEISDKTNILAINASIEASGAGEKGIGFKVIANEIRNLAESTGVYADDISKSIIMMIKNIKKASKGSIESKDAMYELQKVIKKFDSDQAVITKSIDDIESKGNIILSKANEVNEKQEDVFQSALNINNSVQEIDKQMTEVLERSNSTYQRVKGVTKSVEDSLGDFELIRNMSAKNKHELSLSRDSIGMFKSKPGL